MTVDRQLSCVMCHKGRVLSHAEQPLLTVLTLWASTQELGNDADDVLPESCSGENIRCCNGPVQCDHCTRGDLRMCHLGYLILQLQLRATVWQKVPYYTSVCTINACCITEIAEGSKLLTATQESVTAHAFHDERIRVHRGSECCNHESAAAKFSSSKATGRSMVGSCMGLPPTWQISPRAFSQVVMRHTPESQWSKADDNFRSRHLQGLQQLSACSTL